MEQEKLQLQIIDLQNELKKYNKLEYTTERLKANIKQLESDLLVLWQIKKENEAVIIEQVETIKMNSNILDINYNAIKKVKDDLLELGKKYNSSTSTIEKLDKQIKQKEDKIENLIYEEEQIILKNKDIYYKEEEEHLRKLAKIKNDIEKQNRKIEENTKCVLEKEWELEEAKNNLRIKHIEIQKNNWIMAELTKEVSLLLWKKEVLKNEIELMLKEWWEIAKEYKVTKSWGDRLEQIYKKFI